MRTSIELRMIKDKTAELASMLSDTPPKDLWDDPTVQAVIEDILDKLDIDRVHRAMFLHKALEKYL